jgi:hypothetical protein
MGSPDLTGAVQHMRAARKAAGGTLFGFGQQVAIW